MKLKKKIILKVVIPVSLMSWGANAYGQDIKVSKLSKIENKDSIEYTFKINEHQDTFVVNKRKILNNEKIPLTFLQTYYDKEGNIKKTFFLENYEGDETWDRLTETIWINKNKKLISLRYNNRDKNTLEIIKGKRNKKYTINQKQYHKIYSKYIGDENFHK